METIYEFVKETNIKDTSGHLLNIYKCKTCGKEILKRRSAALKIYKCQHNFKKHQKLENEQKNKKLYSIYSSMKHRCYNLNNKVYQFYGGKGIKVCEKWENNYYEFQKWALENGYKEGLTIDRIKSNGNYEPSNCRWITQEENSRFKSTTNYITINNITKSGTQWSYYIGRSKNYINQMIRRKGLDYVINFLKKDL